MPSVSHVVPSCKRHLNSVTIIRPTRVNVTQLRRLLMLVILCCENVHEIMWKTNFCINNVFVRMNYDLLTVSCLCVGINIMNIFSSVIIIRFSVVNLRAYNQK